MIIRRVREIDAHEVAHFAWTGLRQFQNISFTEKKIARYHSPPKNQERNVKKQAQQIRYCLNQAEEYFRAAQVVSLSTKPLLLYYGAMSLALAEILIKQDGGSSLDKARGQHANHGLDLRIAANPSSLPNLSESATALRAIPIIRGGNRFGTFELWHRSSRETPWAGTRRNLLANGTTQQSIQLLALGDDNRPVLLPIDGFTLLECFQSHPKMAAVMQENELISNIARGSISHTLDEKNGTSKLTIIIHPSGDTVLKEVYNRFKISARDFETIEITEMPDGCIIRQSHHLSHPSPQIRMPFGFQFDTQNIFFSSNQITLNEFGIIYVGLYILGNYARYFPDQWMVDVEACSALSLAAIEFMSIAERRIPLLILSELMQTWHVQRY